VENRVFFEIIGLEKEEDVNDVVKACDSDVRKFI
jgi:hypothetical protein